MIKGTLTQEELTKRCEQVFDLADNEEIYEIYVDDAGRVHISMGEIGTKQENYAWCCFDYIPDMSERPQALDFLLGRRNDFND